LRSIKHVTGAAEIEKQLVMKLNRAPFFNRTAGGKVEHPGQQRHSV
jgi:hypothetical protein